MSLNLLLGLSTMALCLFLQSLLILVAIRYYSRRARLVGDRSYLHSLIVINGVMVLMIGVSTAILMATSGSALRADCD